MAIQQNINSLLGTAQSAVGIAKFIEGQNKQIEETQKATKLEEERQAQKSAADKLEVQNKKFEETMPYIKDITEKRKGYEHAVSRDFQAGIMSSDLDERYQPDTPQQELDKSEKAYKESQKRLEDYRSSTPYKLREAFLNGEIKSKEEYDRKMNEFKFMESVQKLGLEETASKYLDQGLTYDEIIDRMLYSNNQGDVDLWNLPGEPEIHEEDVNRMIKKMAEHDQDAEEADALENNAKENK